MTFSWDKMKKEAIIIKQRRARTQAKAGHKDMAVLHPQWVRDAQLKSPNYVQMDKAIKEEVEKKQIRNETFTRKLHQNG